MTTFRQTVDDLIRRTRLFEDGERLLVGVSGGIDSVVLLDVLNELSRKHQWLLAIGHLNHRLRGKASDGDQEFVEKIAAKYDLPLFSGSENVAEYAKGKGISLEMAARELRYPFLAKSAENFGARKIVLAHHEDDQIELFFLRALRGSGGRGLGGMKAVAVSPLNPQIKLVRPFLPLSKARIRDYAIARKLEFRQDATNDQNEALRNRVRNRLLPFLRREFGDSFSRTIPRIMQTIGSEHDCIRKQAADWLEKMETPFSDLHPAVARQILVRQLREKAIEPDFRLVEQLHLEPGKTFSAANGISVRRHPGGIVEVVRGAVAFATDFNEMEVLLRPDEGEIEFDGILVKWKKVSQTQRASSETNTEFFDVNKLGKRIRLRHWRPGDRMQPIGMNATVKLQNIFVNQRVPQSERHERIVAENENGEIFWVEGLRISERAKVSGQSKVLLQWQWERRIDN